ncbi:hypothetical protein L7F22_053143 [Adiantum nelumboides]|nr:hypothetical protein [Adiantum nelumboides]
MACSMVALEVAHWEVGVSRIELLRSRKLASAKEREEAALNQARHAVQKLRDLHDNLIAAEKAAAGFAARLGEAAKSSMSSHQIMREQACNNFFAQQKQQMIAQQIGPEVPNDSSSPLSHTAKQENEREASKLKTSRAVDDKDIIFAARVADEPSSHVVEGPDEKNVAINPENSGEASASASNTSDAHDNMELLDVPPEVLAQMLEDAKKQVQLEEKSHIDALSRDKAILEKEIKAREIAERARMQER